MKRMNGSLSLYCEKGHAKFGPGLKITSNGYRSCRTCVQANWKRMYAARFSNGRWRQRGKRTDRAWNSLNSSSKKRWGGENKANELDRAMFEDLITDSCFYCGSPPNPINGIDRVDNSVHYVYGNVVTACARCNLAKRTMSIQEFLGWVSLVYKNQERTGAI
jgi:hypothetical protein